MSRFDRDSITAIEDLVAKIKSSKHLLAIDSIAQAAVIKVAHNSIYGSLGGKSKTYPGRYISLSLLGEWPTPRFFADGSEWFAPVLDTLVRRMPEQTFDPERPRWCSQPTRAALAHDLKLAFAFAALSPLETDAPTTEQD